MTVKEMLKNLEESEEFKGYDRIRIREFYPVFGPGHVIDSYCMFGDYTWFPKAKELVAEEYGTTTDVNSVVNAYNIKKMNKKAKSRVSYKYDNYVEYFLEEDTSPVNMFSI